MSKGLNNTLEKTDPNYDELRFLFFETDIPYNSEDYGRIIKVYESNNLDLLVHNTGGGGQHFISPTLVEKKKWKEMIDVLHDINPRFPALCLRIKPNKYVNESDMWYRASVGYKGKTDYRNSFELCLLLNWWFNSEFKGSIPTQLKMRNYPLPCIYCNKQVRKDHVCRT